MPDEKTKLRFATADDAKDNQKLKPVTSPTLEIGQGNYVRKFDAKEQPFECEPDEAQMLLKTGHFVEESPKQKPDKEKKSEPPAVAGGPKPQNLGKIGGSPAPEQ